MKFNVGDRVKFLDTHGGGIIVKILNSKMVRVAIEDGFEIPTLVSNLIPDDYGSPRQDEDRQANMQRQQPVVIIQEHQEDERVSAIRTAGTKQGFNTGIYLAFLPHEQRWLLTGMVDVLLVNNSSYDILFSVVLEKTSKAFSGKDYGSVPPMSKVLITTINREEIETWGKGYLQVLFHAESLDQPVMPLHASFHIKGSKFFQENAYVDVPALEGKSIIYFIGAPQGGGISQVEKKDQVEEEPSIQSHKAILKQEPPLIEKYKSSPGVAVVDLHIEKILDAPSSQDPASYLGIQLDRFSRCLESAIKEGYRKVTFIHGIGEGVLKTSIIAVLRDYEGLDYQEASLLKYGNGAIEVLMRHSKM
ncbi:MAG: DUF2027 domain-containing protein [Bacteroidetes bacterium]|nr:DUF2027 domain-containing protein [Bacteroidota bacterium]